MTEIANNSGRKVLGYRVILLMDKVEEKTAGGVYIPDQAREKEEYAQDTGTIVALGKQAFVDLDESEKPKIGDRCDIKRYDGVFIKSSEATDDDYRIVNDDQILTILTT